MTEDQCILSGVFNLSFLMEYWESLITIGQVKLKF